MGSAQASTIITKPTGTHVTPGSERRKVSIARANDPMRIYADVSQDRLLDRGYTPD